MLPIDILLIKCRYLCITILGNLQYLEINQHSMFRPSCSCAASASICLLALIAHHLCGQGRKTQKQ